MVSAEFIERQSAVRKIVQRTGYEAGFGFGRRRGSIGHVAILCEDHSLIGTRAFTLPIRISTSCARRGIFHVCCLPSAAPKAASRPTPAAMPRRASLEIACLAIDISDGGSSFSTPDI